MKMVVVFNKENPIKPVFVAGPFPSEIEAMEWAESALPTCKWDVVPVTPPC